MRLVLHWSNQFGDENERDLGDLRDFQVTGDTLRNGNGDTIAKLVEDGCWATDDGKHWQDIWFEVEK